ncbi:hypothetical protein yaldo0001_20680 [Yersinia aldovae ATCC 35236]|nr:hypothetical protein yaldo0001_20680 [Yersinia aldovae ATCC 35236]
MILVCFVIFHQCDENHILNKIITNMIFRFFLGYFLHFLM